jgi:hypothetical protein
MVRLITNEELAALLDMDYVPVHRDEPYQPNIQALIDKFPSLSKPFLIDPSLTKSIRNLVSKEEWDALLVDYPIDIDPVLNKICKKRTCKHSRSKINRQSPHTL